jgi:hypothetical protein
LAARRTAGTHFSFISIKEAQMFNSFEKAINMPDSSPESWAPLNMETFDQSFFAGVQTDKGGLGVGAYGIQAQNSSGRLGIISPKSMMGKQLTCPENLPKNINPPRYMYVPRRIKNFYFNLIES